MQTAVFPHTDTETLLMGFFKSQKNAYKFGTFIHHGVTHHTMYPPQNDPPHDAPEPPHRAPKGLGNTFYVVDFCSTFYVTRRKSYHGDWLMRFQICQYFISHMLLDCSICSEIKARIFRRDLEDRTGLFFTKLNQC